MGGNALQAASVRLPASRYRIVEQNAVQTLQQHFPGRRIEAVLAYADKTDFGDLDILVEDHGGYDAMQMASALQASEVVRNGDVTSMGLSLAEGIFQVDLIQTPSASFDFAVRYFGLNDFGNLIGRIAHQFGARFGHQGLRYPLRDPDNSNHLIAELCITTDFSNALDLLAYDAERYETMRITGQFRTLHDIFQYVVSSPYVNREIYLLDNRNHKARTRDAKRATYTAFLIWLEEQVDGVLPAYPWAESGSIERQQQKQEFLESAFAEFPAFKQAYDQALAVNARSKQARLQYNGSLAAEFTGLSGKPLGELMARVRNAFVDETAFEDFFITSSRETVKARFLQEAAAGQHGKKLKT